MAYNQANSRQIKPGILDNTHIKAGAAIDESKLSINWATRGDEILSKKLIVDYVQVEDKSVASGLNNVAVTSSISAPVADAVDKKGAVVQSGKNKVILRNATTGEPVISVDGNEVYGKLTHNGTDYVVSFFYKDDAGAEQVYTFAAATTIDFQFPQRFSFLEVAETFAANEKFVDGASDVSARLDLQQIVKDAFGAAYTLDQDGTANRAKSVVQELTDRTVGTVNTSVTASGTIDEVVAARDVEVDLKTRLGKMAQSISDNATAVGNAQTEITNARGAEATLDARLDGIDNTISGVKNEVETARGGQASLDARLDAIDDAATGSVAVEVKARQDADQAIIDDLASTEAGKGASAIGVEDVDGKFTASTVEGVLKEIEGRVAAVEETGGEEVTTARTSDVTGEHASLDARLEAGEARYEAVKTEVEGARVSTAKSADGGTTPKTFASVDARIEELETDAISLDGRLDTAEGTISGYSTSITTLEGKAHKHFAEDKQVLAGDNLINTARYDLTTGTYVMGDKSLQVYINGFLQMAGVHYVEVAGGEAGVGVAINVTPELIAEGDVIQLRWSK